MLAATSITAAGIAGAAAGALIGLAAGLVPMEVRVAACTLGAAVVAVAAVVSPARLPQVNRETHQSLLGQGPIRWAFINGSLLGLGFTSRLGYWVWYLVPLGCILLGSPEAGAAIWGVYGLARLGAAVGVVVRMRHKPSGISDMSRRLLGLRPAVRRASGPVTTTLAAALALWLGL